MVEEVEKNKRSAGEEKENGKYHGIKEMQKNPGKRQDESEYRTKLAGSLGQWPFTSKSAAFAMQTSGSPHFGHHWFPNLWVLPRFLFAHTGLHRLQDGCGTEKKNLHYLKSHLLCVRGLRDS